MHGNVFELCQDWHGRYPSGTETVPTGPSSGTYLERAGTEAGTSSQPSAIRRSASGPRLTTRSTLWAFVCSAVPSSKAGGRTVQRIDRLARRQPAFGLRRQPELCQQAAEVTISSLRTASQ
jgi:hypothetical protein